MNKIDGYGVYQNMFANNMQAKRQKEDSDVKSQTALNGWEQDAVKVERSAKIENKSSVQLSDAAQKLLDELKEKYTNMDFMVANYSSDEEAQELLSRGTKEYSVLMDPETLEKMASDEEAKEKYIGILEDSTSKLDDMKEQLKDSDENVTRIGFSVGNDGQVSYFAELEKSSKEQSDRIEAARDEKRAAKKEETKKAAKKAVEEKQQESLETKRKEHANALYGKQGESVKRTTVIASSTEELLEKIKNVDWDSITEEQVKSHGGRIDFTV